VALAEAVAVAWVVACAVDAELVPVVAGLLVELLEPPEEHPAASRATLKRQADAATGLRTCMKCLLEGRPLRGDDVIIPRRFEADF
jgi:hypothetical protein